MEIGFALELIVPGELQTNWWRRMIYSSYFFVLNQRSLQIGSRRTLRTNIKDQLKIRRASSFFFFCICSHFLLTMHIIRRVWWGNESGFGDGVLVSLKAFSRISCSEFRALLKSRLADRRNDWLRRIFWRKHGWFVETSICKTALDWLYSNAEWMSWESGQRPYIPFCGDPCWLLKSSGLVGKLLDISGHRSIKHEMKTNGGGPQTSNWRSRSMPSSFN